MYSRSTLYTLLIIFTCYYVNAQTPKTLLWRISGKDFKVPCYLYGTMHSQDKRVYHLGDSVYSSMNSCEGFAMEVDPTEMLDTFMNELEIKDFDIAYRKAIENDILKRDPADMKAKIKRMDSLIEKMMKRRELSDKEINRIIRVYKRRYRNDMRTMLDLYLFDIAKRQGKMLGGVEDLSEHNSIRDELGNPFDPEAFLKQQRKKYVDVEEWMISTYVSADLDKLHEFSKLTSTERQMSLIVYNRNLKMANSIDSLGRLRSTFCAVGAAHLPGDSGVINLLRLNGYEVTPVFSSLLIEPEDFKLTNKINTLISYSDADSNYVVQMPGRPMLPVMITEKLVLRAYKELSNEIILMCGLYEDGKINKSIDKELDEIKQSFINNGIKYSVRKFKGNQLDGYDIRFKNRDGYLQMHLFYDKGKLYMFAAGSKDEDSLHSARCENYLASYRMLLNKPQSESILYPFVYPDKAFSVSMPAQPKKEYIKGEATYTKEEVTLFSSLDPRKKISYLVVIKEPLQGYYADVDSVQFDQTIRGVMKGLNGTAMAEESLLVDGFPALKLKLVGESEKKNHVIYAVLVMRHNRLYCVSARGLAAPGNEAMFDKFINSFHFIPYQETKFTERTAGNALFSVSAPSPILTFPERKDKPGTDGQFTKQMEYYAFDSSKAMTYGIVSVAIGQFYWSENTNALLDEYIKTYFPGQLAVNNVYNVDSLIYMNNVKVGNLAAKEMFLKDIVNNSYTRLRFVQYADSIFVLTMRGAPDLLTDRNAAAFFNSFKFINERFESTVFLSKTEKILAGLQSSDHDLNTAALGALQNGFKYPPEDAGRLFNAMLIDYKDLTNRQIIAKHFAGVLQTAREEELLDFVNKHYAALRGQREDIRSLMIKMLSKRRSSEAYRLIGNLIATDPPEVQGFELGLENFVESPGLAAALFPNIMSKLKDEQYSPAVLELLNMLIDSNKIQYSSVIAHEEDVLQIGKNMLKVYREKNNDNYFMPHTEAVFSLLAKMNQKRSRAVLNDFIELQNNNLNILIIVELAKNNQAVSTEEIDRFSKDPGRRVLLYNTLSKVGRPYFFKGEYARQKLFAEAYVMHAVENEVPENVPKYYSLAAVKDTMLDSRICRYYIFKVACEYRYETAHFTCVTGPFSPEESILSIKEGEEAFVLYKTKYDAKLVDGLFPSFINKSRLQKK